MIRLDRLNHGELHLNADLIATVESHHDTVVTLDDGKTYVVLDTADDVVDAVRTHRASVLALAERMLAGPVADEPGTRLLLLRPDDLAGTGD